MTSVVELYEALSTAPDDRARARVIAEAFERLEDRYPHLPDLATQGHLRETELRLQKEIKEVEARLQKEIKEVEARLQMEIKQVEARLQMDIEQVRADLTLQIVQLRGEVSRLKLDLLKWLVPLMFGQVLAIAALVKLL
jgi:hypothetical protein